MSNEIQRSAANAEQVLSNPAFTAGFDALRAQYISTIERITLDGHPEQPNRLAEAVRSLQVLTEVKRQLALRIRAADAANLRDTAGERL